MTESVQPGTTPLVAMALMDMAVSIVCEKIRKKERFEDKTLERENFMAAINIHVS